MEPRKLSLRKERSTSVPAEFLGDLAAAIRTEFADFLAGREIFAEGRIYSDEVLLCVGFKPEPKGLKQLNFEASADLGKGDTLKTLRLCSDVLASVFADYVASKETLDLPLYWKEIVYQKQTVYFQTSGRNTDLERQANELLGIEASDALFTEAEGDDITGEDEDFEGFLSETTVPDPDKVH